MTDDREFAVMSHVRVGCSDRGRMSLMFTTTLADGVSAADHWLTGADMTSFVEVSGVADVRDLEGRPCLVRRDGGLIRVLGPGPKR